jgi:uncharacterized Fe-S cluster protein YjdI
MDIRKEYDNGEITVVWKPGLCFHAKECVKGLPMVFDPDKKPWIDVSQAQTQALKDTIDKCPSGALTYYNTADGRPEDLSDAADDRTRVEVLEGGPLMVYGSLVVTHADGSVEERKRQAAFCRCGKTGNVPFCDGSHNN